MPCSLKLHDFVTYTVMIFLLDLLCSFFQFILLSSVVPISFVVYILPLPLMVHFTNHFQCNPWPACSPLDFPNQITCIYHTFLDAVPLHFHIQLHSVFLIQSCIEKIKSICRWHISIVLRLINVFKGVLLCTTQLHFQGNQFQLILQDIIRTIHQNPWKELYNHVYNLRERDLSLYT